METECIILSWGKLDLDPIWSWVWLKESYTGFDDGVLHHCLVLQFEAAIGDLAVGWVYDLIFPKDKVDHQIFPAN